MLGAGQGTVASVKPDLSVLTPGRWRIDQSRSRVGFEARHLLISRVSGCFERFSGTVTVGDDPLASSVAAEVDLSSVRTGNRAQDERLLSAEFFTADLDPAMHFTSTLVKVVGDGFAVIGDLALNGATHPVTFALDSHGAALRARADINRKHWGLIWNRTLEAGGLLVGNKVRLSLDLMLVESQT